MNLLKKKTAVVNPKASTEPVDAPEVPAVDDAPVEDEPETVPTEDAPEAPEEKAPEQIDLNEQAATIMDICMNAGMPERASAFIRNGVSVSDVRGQVDKNQEINQVCALAGKPDRANTFIESGVSVKEVRNTLISEMSAAEENISPVATAETIKKEQEMSIDPIQADVQRRIDAKAASKKKTK